LYNIADAQILLTSNEGWGLTITEAILAGTPIIANVTGGMQDQMRFEDKDGKWFTPTADFPSNHNGTLTKHGEWTFPVFPTSRSIQGSPQTPYIFDDRCKWEDATERIKELYNLPRAERKARGLKGREWAIEEAGFTSEKQAERVMEAFNELFSTWKPKEKYEITNATEYKGKFLPHKIYY
jgi:glycosyltransferase involved in cell wall biosynthesis